MANKNETSEEEKKEGDKSKPAPEKAQPKPEEPVSDDENPFDFGGLPKRDLKKNLGCG